MDGTSLNITQDLINQLKEVIPQAFTEDKIDISRLQTILGDYFTTDAERYGLSWAGKSEAYKVLQSPSTATLIPNPEQSIDWDNAENIFIEGENLEVLKVLQKSYYGKVKMIYIDPPYNTGSDSFIYPDKFSETKEEYLKRTQEIDEDGFMKKEGFFNINSRESGKFHSNWLSMMLPRLFLARNLLKEDGLIFISIDDNEAGNLRLLLDEIFGEDNFIGNVVWNSTKSVTNTALISVSHNFNFIYCKNIDYFIKNRHEFRLPEDGEGFSNPDNDPRGVWKADPFQVGGWRPNQQYEIKNPKTGEVYKPNEGCSWKNDFTKFQELIQDNRIVFGVSGEGGPQRKRFLTDALERGKVSKTWWDNVGTTTNGTQSLKKMFDNKIVFTNPKPIDLIQKMVLLGDYSKKGIILDFFAGSGTTAQAVMELNERDNGERKFICVQLPEQIQEETEAYKAGYRTIADISKTRIEKVIKKIKDERNGKLNLESRQNLGFRKYTLANSNFKIWRSDFIDSEEDLMSQMQLFIKPEKEGSKTKNILWELLIKNGITLTDKIKELNLEDGSVIYITSDKKIVFVLDKYTQDTQTKVLELKPKTIICLDSLFQNNDNFKTNAQLKFKDNNITFKTI